METAGVSISKNMMRLKHNISIDRKKLLIKIPKILSRNVLVIIIKYFRYSQT